MVSLKKEKQNEVDQVNHNSGVDSTTNTDILEHSIHYKVDLYLVIVSASSVLFYCLLLSKPSYFVLNEEHHSDVQKNYLSSNFLLDVNPPGLPLVLSLITVLLGFDINNSPQSDTLKLFYCRLISALAGSAVPPLVYLILRTMKVSTLISTCGAVLVLSNSVLLTDSRFISANPIMALTSLLALYFLCKTRSEKYPCVKNYVAMSVCLGISMTMLHLGFNSYLFIAGFVVYQEFQKFGDLSKPEKELWRRYLCVAGTVVFLPQLLYYLTYWHLVRSCHKSGVTDPYLSTSFQAELEGNVYHSIKNTDKTWIVNNSNIMLHTEDPYPCYLHSHPFDYPLTDVEQFFQQVTCYSAVDGNNWFKLEAPPSINKDAAQVIQHDDVVRMKHLLTGKYLTVFDSVEAVSNELANLIAGTSDGEGESWWIVEIVDEKQFSGGLWAANYTHVRFRSNVTSQYIVQTGKRLPEWGFEQMDIGGARNAAAVWTATHAQLSNSLQVEELRSTEYSSFSKILEIHKILFVNGRYDRVKDHAYDTSPYTWLIPGLSMLYSYTNKEIVQAKTNTLLEQGMLLCLFSHIAVFTLLLIRRARGFVDVTEEIWSNLCERNVVLLLGFLFHYSAFFFMQRPLFIFQFQLTHTYLVMSCVSFVDLLLRHFAHHLLYTLPVFTAYTAMVFVRFLFHFHFSVGYPADESEFFLLVD